MSRFSILNKFSFNFNKKFLASLLVFTLTLFAIPAAFGAAADNQELIAKSDIKINPQDLKDKAVNAADLDSETEVKTSALSILYTFKTGTVGTYYSDFVKISGGTSPYDAYKSGSVPPGLSLTQSGAYIYLRGTPTSSGRYTFRLYARDYYNRTTSKTLTVTINGTGGGGGGSSGSMSILYTFKTGTVGTYYSDFVKISGGTSPYDAYKSGSVPPGLSLTQSGAYIYLRGTPTSSGSYTFRLYARDYYNRTTSKTLTVTINSTNGGGGGGSSGSMSILYTFKNGKVGTYYSDFVKISGGTSPYDAYKSGSIPPGLSLTQSGSYIYLRGTPTRLGTYTFTLYARDYYNRTTSKRLSVYIASRYSSSEYDGADNENDTDNANAQGDEAQSESDTKFNSKYEIFDAADLKFVSGDAEFDNDNDTVTAASTAENLTFEVGSWKDSENKDVEVSNLKVYINDELSDIAVNDDSSFNIALDSNNTGDGETANKDFYVYVKAEADGNKILRSKELAVVNGAESSNSSAKSSATQKSDDNSSSRSGCNSGANGMLILALALSALAIRSKSKI